VVREADLNETEAGLIPASAGWFVLNARDARWFQRSGRDSLVDETARRYGACADVETQDGDVAHANVPPSQPSRYRDGVLPD
jgi:hypothetical protein